MTIDHWTVSDCSRKGTGCDQQSPAMAIVGASAQKGPAAKKEIDGLSRQSIGFEVCVHHFGLYGSTSPSRSNKAAVFVTFIIRSSVLRRYGRDFLAGRASVATALGILFGNRCPIVWVFGRLDTNPSIGRARPRHDSVG